MASYHFYTVIYAPGAEHRQHDARLRFAHDLQTHGAWALNGYIPIAVYGLDHARPRSAREPATARIKCQGTDYAPEEILSGLCPRARCLWRMDDGDFWEAIEQQQRYLDEVMKLPGAPSWAQDGDE